MVTCWCSEVVPNATLLPLIWWGSERLSPLPGELLVTKVVAKRLSPLLGYWMLTLVITQRLSTLLQ